MRQPKRSPQLHRLTRNLDPITTTQQLPRAAKLLVRAELTHLLTLMRAQFTAILEPGEGGVFHARCKEVPGTEVEAANPRAALETLADAISIVFEVSREVFDGAPSREPEPSTPLATVHPITVDLAESRLLSAG